MNCQKDLHLLDLRTVRRFTSRAATRVFISANTASAPSRAPFSTGFCACSKRECGVTPPFLQVNAVPTTPIARHLGSAAHLARQAGHCPAERISLIPATDACNTGTVSAREVVNQGESTP